MTLSVSDNATVSALIGWEHDAEELAFAGEAIGRSHLLVRPGSCLGQGVALLLGAAGRAAGINSRPGGEAALRPGVIGIV